MSVTKVGRLFTNVNQYTNVTPTLSVGKKKYCDVRYIKL